MMKKQWLVLGTAFAALGLVQGCGRQESKQSETPDAAAVSIRFVKHSNPVSELSAREGGPTELVDTTFGGGGIIYFQDATVFDNHYGHEMGTGSSSVTLSLKAGTYFIYAIAYSGANMSGSLYCGAATGDDGSVGTKIALGKTASKELTITMAVANCASAPFGRYAPVTTEATLEQGAGASTVFCARSFVGFNEFNSVLNEGLTYNNTGKCPHEAYAVGYYEAPGNATNAQSSGGIGSIRYKYPTFYVGDFVKNGSRVQSGGSANNMAWSNSGGYASGGNASGAGALGVAQFGSGGIVSGCYTALASVTTSTTAANGWHGAVGAPPVFAMPTVAAGHPDAINIVSRASAGTNAARIPFQVATYRDRNCNTPINLYSFPSGLGGVEPALYGQATPQLPTANRSPDRFYDSFVQERLSGVSTGSDAGGSGGSLAVKNLSQNAKWVISGGTWTASRLYIKASAYNLGLFGLTPTRK